MLYSSNLPSNPLLMELSVDIGSLLVVRLPTKLLPNIGIFSFLMGISSVVTMSSKISAYVA
jgi:hypothetical protein